MTCCCRGLNNLQVEHVGPMNCGVTTGLVIVTNTTNGARPYGGVLYVRIAIRVCDRTSYMCARNRSADFNEPIFTKITPARRRYVETFCTENDISLANRYGKYGGKFACKLKLGRLVRNSSLLDNSCEELLHRIL